MHDPSSTPPESRPRRTRGPWIPLVRLGGIRVFLDPLLPVLLVALVLVGAGPGDATPLLLAFAFLVLFVAVHELGHAAAARLSGLAVDGIYLHVFPVTYVAASESPRTELVVALAGPAASLVLGLLLLGVRALLPAPWPEAAALVRDPWLLAALANLAMGILNLVPVLPADGGRALRAALTLPLGRARAARVVGGLGVVLGFALAAVSLIAVPLPWAAWLALLGLYVAWVSARQVRAA